MKKSIAFLVFWIIDSLILFLASMLFPGYFVLGTFRVNVFWATVVSGLVWTAIVWYAEPVMKMFKIKVQGPIMMLLSYWLVNFIALWLIARLAPYTGFGSSRFVWLLALALLADIIQALVMKASAPGRN